MKNRIAIIQRGVWVVAIAFVLLAIIGLGRLASSGAQFQPVNQSRIEQRLKILADTRTAGAQGLYFYDWQNKAKEIVRLPIDRAMELTLEEWKNPAAARSNLLARAAIALAVPPPPSAVTNIYE